MLTEVENKRVKQAAMVAGQQKQIEALTDGEPAKKWLVEHRRHMEWH